MGDEKASNPGTDTHGNNDLSARAEALRTELTASSLPASTADEVIGLVDECLRAVPDLERRLAEAESSLASSRKRIAQELVRQDALRARLVTQEKLASLGGLAAGIAHEIKNHLNFVKNFAEILVSLAEELDEQLQPEAAKFSDEVFGEVGALTTDIHDAAKKIHSHGQTAASIISSMLQHSRGGQPEFRPTDLNALVDESLRLAYHGARAQHPGFDVTYSTALDDRLEPVVAAGQDISRVLLNVLGNAFDAAWQRAEQRVDAYQPRVAITTQSVDDRAEILVHDNGIGIDKALLPEVTTPFFTTKPVGQGTGLGLSISDEIVTTGHGGHFSIESEQGVGTTVRIVLPKARG